MGRGKGGGEEGKKRAREGLEWREKARVKRGGIKEEKTERTNNNNNNNNNNNKKKKNNKNEW